MKKELIGRIMLFYGKLYACVCMNHNNHVTNCNTVAYQHYVIVNNLKEKSNCPYCWENVIIILLVLHCPSANTDDHW